MPRKVERDVIARGAFTSVADLSRKLMKYIRAYAKSARPIRWTYTDLRRRIGAKESLGRPTRVYRPLRDFLNGRLVVINYDCHNQRRLPSGDTQNRPFMIGICQGTDGVVLAPPPDGGVLLAHAS